MTDDTKTTTQVAAMLDRSFPFSLDRLPLSGPDNMPTNFYGMFRSDIAGPSSMVGQPVTNRYEPHTLDDVKALAEAATHAFPGAELDMRASFAVGHNVYLGPSHECRRSIMNDKEGLFPRFTIIAGVGGSAMAISLGLYRDCCLNMVMFRKNAEFTRIIRHTASMRTRMPDLILQFQELGSRWESLVDHLAAMQQVEVATADFLRQIWKEPNENSAEQSNKSYYNRMESVMRRVAKDRTLLGIPIGDLHKATGWEMFNAVQGYTQHDQNRRNQPAEFDRAIMSSYSAEVDKAYTLALSA